MSDGCDATFPKGNHDEYKIKGMHNKCSPISDTVNQECTNIF